MRARSLMGLIVVLALGSAVYYCIPRARWGDRRRVGVRQLRRRFELRQLFARIPARRQLSVWRSLHRFQGYGHPSIIRGMHFIDNWQPCL